eukprot:Selendium_serpulae@DN1852_c0_g1_i1.p1
MIDHYPTHHDMIDHYPTHHDMIDHYPTHHDMIDHYPTHHDMIDHYPTHHDMIDHHHDPTSWLPLIAFRSTPVTGNNVFCSRMLFKSDLSDNADELSTLRLGSPAPRSFRAASPLRRTARRGRGPLPCGPMYSALI